MDVTPLHDKMKLTSELDNSIANDVSRDNKITNKPSSPIFGIDVAETVTLIGYGWYVKPMWKFFLKMTVLQSERVRQFRKKIRKLKNRLDI